LREILHEINIGGEDPNASQEPDEDDGDQNFMDDNDDSDTSDNTTDDSSNSDDEGDQNFMDDDSDNSEEEQPDTNDKGSDEDDGDQNFMDDDSSDNSEDDTTSDDNNEETDSGDENSGDQNFMDDDGGEDDSGETEDSGKESNDNNESEENSDDNSEEDENGYDINKIEDELFSSLTPEQIAIKNHELKNQFIELYSIIGSTLVRINDISKSNENINVLKFITEKLLELREMIDFNITTAYQTRTYIENNIIYQQCIATLNAIAEIIDNIPKLDGKKENEDENEIDNKGIPVEQDKESSETLDISDSSVSNYQEESTDYSSEYNDLF
jgi:hypothetical protein